MIPGPLSYRDFRETGPRSQKHAKTSLHLYPYLEHLSVAMAFYYSLIYKHAKTSLHLYPFSDSVTPCSNRLPLSPIPSPFSLPPYPLPPTPFDACYAGYENPSYPCLSIGSRKSASHESHASHEKK